MVFFFFILFGEWVVDLKSANSLDHNSCLKIPISEKGLVCLAFRFWEESWMAVRITVPRTKAGSGQGMLLLSFGLLSDQASRVTLLPSLFSFLFFFLKWLRIVSWEENSSEINRSVDLDGNIILCRCVFFMKGASCTVKLIHLGID